MTGMLLFCGGKDGTDEIRRMPKILKRVGEFLNNVIRMYKVIFNEIVSILNNNNGLASPILNIHLPKRAKFERYLQSVLANKLKSTYADTEIEKEYPNNNNSHADIFANNTFIELKTPNTNYAVANIPVLTKPITTNRQGVINDIRKLRKAGVDGVVAFVLFPIDMNKPIYLQHVNKIKKELNHNLCEERVVGDFYVFSAKV